MFICIKHAGVIVGADLNDGGREDGHDVLGELGDILGSANQHARPCFVVAHLDKHLRVFKK
jgi:hypothetical protein